MILVVATCATDVLGLFDPFSFHYDALFRWIAAGYLLGVAGVFFHCEFFGENVRGANDNASGVAVLLDLAERFAEKPLENSEVRLVATGSQESWMDGVRHLLQPHDLDRKNTYFLNISHVGAGALHYTTAEGMIWVYPCAREMVDAAKAVAPPYDVRPCRLRSVPSDAMIPLARGFRALGIVALDEHGIPPHWNWFTDTVPAIDLHQVKTAAEFADALLRHLDTHG
jgi:hypothetical protein